MTHIQKITPFLWFDGRAKEAVDFYTSVFEDSRILSASKLQGGPAEGAYLIDFELAGQRFTALDGGPMFQFSAAISLVVNCESQEEVDHFWVSLSEDGEQEMCGWVRDRFGVSWQVIPTDLGELLSQPSRAVAVMDALLAMRKIDIGQLRAAYAAA